MSLFVDTSVWYAAADRGDRNNARAKAALEEEEEDLVTSDHVLVEVWALLHHRLGADAAERFWQGLRKGAAALECVVPEDVEAAWRIGEAWPDQDFSLVDRTCFAIMQRLGIDRVATLDRDFAIFRFGPKKRRSFTIVR